MYFPFLRGLQHEIFALGRLTTKIGKSNVMPILEPAGFKYVKRFKIFAVDKMPLILIVNPRDPEGKLTTKEIHTKIIEEQLSEHPSLNIGILITLRTRISEIENLITRYTELSYKISLIHYQQFSNPTALVALLRGKKNVNRHVFDNDRTDSSYQSNFTGDKRERVLLKNSFVKQDNNANYPSTAYEFSDFHKTYKPSYDGFGDYTIVGDIIRKGGSFARTVAIHFTFPQRNKIMIQHFLSRTDAVSDNAGKFAEAVSKLAAVLKANHSYVVGDAAQEYIDIDTAGIVKTLGYAKELSIMNHIEVYMTKV